MREHLTVGFRVDPACPWCWITSRWIAEAAEVRDITVEYRLFALSIVNRDSAKESYREALARMEGEMRLLVAVRRRGGQEALQGVYTEIGEARHERGEASDDALLRRALVAAGLDAALLTEASQDPSTLAELTAEHEAATVAGAFGVPTIELDGCAPMFGPVIDARITGEAAGELWDHTEWAIRNPHVLEFKRDPRPQPQIGRIINAAEPKAVSQT